MNPKSFFILDNYTSRLKLLQKKRKISYLQKQKVETTKVFRTWKVSNDKIDSNLKLDFNNKYFIFGIPVDLGNIDWHKDLFSGFSYPQERFDKLNAPQYFNKGIELVFPWEQSRFYFGPHLAQKYFLTGDNKYYLQFKKLTLDWIEKNPFLTGVNWLSTMDVAIRAINWIITVNLFYNFFKNDPGFEKILSQSLIMHAKYIDAFPLIEKGGLTTNHTTSAYTGLLFLALFLKDYKESDRWLEKAVGGLESCINDQIYEDGVDFEGSIPYHRLVLELFTYSAILSLANGISLSNDYFGKLFKMFEYTAAYIDKSGNAPQVGDNDSGRVLIFNTDKNNNPYGNEHDHSYLLSLGESVFNYSFPTQSTNSDKYVLKFIPKINKVNLDILKAKPRATDRSISFENGGTYILKNDKISLLVSCFPLGQGGKGGHNNLDVGSFTLSIDGNPIFVDPGTLTYTRDRGERDKFRAYTYHNTVFNEKDAGLNLSENDYWTLKKYYSCRDLKFDGRLVQIKINFNNDSKIRTRKFLVEGNSVIIEDQLEGEFYSRINFDPRVDIFKQTAVSIQTNFFDLYFDSDCQYEIKQYDYSPHYGLSTKSSYIQIKAFDKLNLKVKTK